MNKIKQLFLTYVYQMIADFTKMIDIEPCQCENCDYVFPYFIWLIRNTDNYISCPNCNYKQEYRF